MWLVDTFVTLSVRSLFFTCFPSAFFPRCFAPRSSLSPNHSFEFFSSLVYNLPCIFPTSCRSKEDFRQTRRLRLSLPSTTLKLLSSSSSFFLPSPPTTMAPLVRLLPPSYSAPSTSQLRLPANAHASSSTSRSSSKPRAPRLARQDSTFGDDEDYLHWAPSPPFVEGSKLPSSVTISYPPQDLLVLLAPPKVDPLGEEDWSGIDEGRDVSRIRAHPFSSCSSFLPFRLAS